MFSNKSFNFEQTFKIFSLVVDFQHTVAYFELDSEAQLKHQTLMMTTELSTNGKLSSSNILDTTTTTFMQVILMSLLLT